MSPNGLNGVAKGGFDVPAWISENLFDMLILGQGLTELPTLGEFRDLMNDRRLPIYPCLTTYGNGYPISPEPVVRGSAANLWRDGADGIYTFNWFFYGNWRRQLLGEIADPSRLLGRDKLYTLMRRVEAAPREPGGDYIRYNTQKRAAPLPFNLTVEEGSKSVSISVGPDVRSAAKRPRQAALWIAADFLGERDVLELTLNGHRLQPQANEQRRTLKTLGRRVQIPMGNGLLGFPAKQFVDATFPGRSFVVPVGHLRPGSNKLSIALKRRTPGFEHPLRVTRLELETHS